MPYQQIRKKVNKLLITLYVLMVMGLVGSLSFALYENWQLKLKSTRSELARQAGIGNFMVENAMASATKSLNAAQRSMAGILNGGPLSALQAHEILQASLSEFNAYSNSSYEGLLLYLDPQGQLQARTDHYPAEHLNYADQSYFQQLRQHPETERAIGPLDQARTTGEWVFHVAVPLKDSKGHFRGVLAQQIRAVDIARDLDRYVDNSRSAQMVSQSADAGLYFVYPLSLLSRLDSGEIATPYADFARRSTSPQDAFSWPPQARLIDRRQLLVGYEHSEVSGQLTTSHLPLSEVWAAFVLENLFLLALVGLGLVLITGLFTHLFRIYNRLTAALHDSFYDTLTQIPNRRAFDDMFPRLLREAIRSREPLSVLFIDIDHFKRFNDDYGHDGGDAALKAVAIALGNCATRPLDFICRWGGEEFVVILPHTPVEAAMAIAQRTLDTVRNLALSDLQGESMRSVTVSIGICSNQVHSQRLGLEMVNAADEAMQQAKQAGRDRCILHRHTDGFSPL
jgi:diguanylate cyclase (GGDEF)-like protein